MLNKLGINLIAAFIYIAVAQVFLQLAFIHPNASPIWPLSGLSIGFLVLHGLRFWPTIFLGAFSANLITNVTIHYEFSLLQNGLAVSGIAIANTIEALVGAWFITQQTHGRDCLDYSFDIFLFVIFVGFFPTMLSAVGGVMSLAAAGFVSWDQSGRVILTWYTANVYGVLLFTPCLFILSRPVKIRWRLLHVLELLLLFMFLILIGQTISGFYFSPILEGWPKSYMVIPLLLWIGARYQYYGILIAILILSAIAMTGTIRAYEAFPAETPDLALLYLQLFLGIVTIMSISFVALLTELKRYNGSLEELVAIRTQGINDLLQEKSDLMALIAHDLQSPILGLQNILRLRHSPKYQITTNEWESILVEMEETCANMYHLVNRHLTSMAAEQCSGQIKYRRENINQLLHDSIQPHMLVAQEKGIVIIDKISNDPFWLSTDAESIRRIVDNLLSNAIKYSPSRSSILVSNFEQGNHYCFLVSDQGVGIEKKQLTTLFAKFQRNGRMPSGQESYGLGLYSVQQLVTKLNGEVLCKSIEGIGSEFKIKLPIELPSDKSPGKSN